MNVRIFLLFACATWAPAVPAGTTMPGVPNVVAITPRLVTSGQPSAPALASLGAKGFQAVLYLAPPTVRDAVPDEQAILERQGIEYVNIPIPFDRPGAEHFEAVAEALERLRERKVLVHCQVNMRASTMVFLYRVIVLGEDPESAYDAVARIWSPRGPWKRLLETQLGRHGVAFEPY